LSYQFLSLIPYLASSEDMQASNLDWMGDLIDVPVSLSDLIEVFLHDLPFTSLLYSLHLILKVV